MERQVKPNDHFEFSNVGNAENHDVNEHRRRCLDGDWTLTLICTAPVFYGTFLGIVSVTYNQASLVGTGISTNMYY